MKSLIKEPLVHSPLLGALLFVIYGAFNRGGGGEERPNAVRITEKEVEWLSEMWVRTWQRPPTEGIHLEKS